MLSYNLGLYTPTTGDVKSNAFLVRREENVRHGELCEEFERMGT